MLGPYAVGLGKRKKCGHGSEERENFFSSSVHTTPLPENATPLSEVQTPLPMKRRRVTHADADVIPKFRPEDNTSNVSNWLHKIDQLGDIYGWEPNDKQFLMQLRLRGSARRWYDDLDEYNLDWEGWKDALKSAFPRSTEFVDKLEAMLARTKRDSETMTTYYHDKLSLLKKCRISGEDAISCIIKGLPMELRINAKAYQCQSPDMLYYGYLSSLENYKKVEANAALQRSTWRRGAADGGTTYEHSNHKKYEDMRRCYICRRGGHEARNCRSLLSCGTCQRVGHTAATCWSTATPSCQATRQAETGQSRVSPIK